MKLGPVPKLDKRNLATSNKFDDDFMSANCNVIVFFQFMANLEQLILTFLLLVTLYLNKNSKTENRTKKSLTQLSY